MKQICRERLPHNVKCLQQLSICKLYTCMANFSLKWWGIKCGRGCRFFGKTRFYRHPNSLISIGNSCTFRSSQNSNLIGINRPCMVSTLKESAQISIGNGCGFSGTVIGSALKIDIHENVRCGANTLITDTDWHSDDNRVGLDLPIVIEENAWLGYNATVLKGAFIGRNSVIAAGSIVTSKIPPNVIAGGIPAKVLKDIQQDNIPII